VPSFCQLGLHQVVVDAVLMLVVSNFDFGQCEVGNAVRPNVAVTTEILRLPCQCMVPPSNGCVDGEVEKEVWVSIEQ